MLSAQGQKSRARLGELLVQAGVVTAERLAEVLLVQATEGGRRKLGELLVERGLLDESQLTQVLGRQLSVPWVSLYHVDFSRQLLNLVPREIAEAYSLIPVYVRQVREYGDTLYVATDDPTNEEGLARVSVFAGLPVRPMIAAASDIRAAIRAYYGSGAGVAPSFAQSPPRLALGHPVEARPPPAQPQPPPNLTPMTPRRHAEPPTTSAVPQAEAPVPTPRPASVDDAPPSSGTDPDLEIQSVRPPPRRRPGAASMDVTLLDGTRLTIPTVPNQRRGDAPISAGEQDQLTTRDVLAALRAVSHGADASEILGENPRWEAMFSALLSLLLKKHLIADWEFVEELRKI